VQSPTIKQLWRASQIPSPVWQQNDGSSILGERVQDLGDLFHCELDLLCRDNTTAGIVDPRNHTFTFLATDALPKRCKCALEPRFIFSCKARAFTLSFNSFRDMLTKRSFQKLTLRKKGPNISKQKKWLVLALSWAMIHPTMEPFHQRSH